MNTGLLTVEVDEDQYLELQVLGGTQDAVYFTAYDEGNEACVALDRAQAVQVRDWLEQILGDR